MLNEAAGESRMAKWRACPACGLEAVALRGCCARLGEGDCSDGIQMAAGVRTAREGQEIRKGDELGIFSYGGSTHFMATEGDHSEFGRPGRSARANSNIAAEGHPRTAHTTRSVQQRVNDETRVVL
ncbi:phosphatidylserine decarboxylase [Streptomyces sp. NPDC057539]|uniref:phosphatidylserine decarboxylase n=1 Tax=Streptomyces sp. NPDC057539 TaxID=3346159 RepID=UPI0036A478EA